VWLCVVLYVCVPVASTLRVAAGVSAAGSLLPPVPQVNCMYWDSSFPRLVTNAQAKDLALEGRLPLLGVCDITCDLHGSVEFLTVSMNTHHHSDRGALAV
jgi:hypothetical protein